MAWIKSSFCHFLRLSALYFSNVKMKVCNLYLPASFQLRMLHLILCRDQRVSRNRAWASAGNWKGHNWQTGVVHNVAQGQVQTSKWSSLRGVHQGISKGWSLSWHTGWMWWFNHRATWWICPNKLFFTQLCFGWLLIRTVVFTMQFPMVPLCFWNESLQDFPITNPFPQLSHTLQEMGVVESGFCIQGFPNI